ncbi:MAG: lactonase family protein [Verrucomicrobia bacterium]|nr:lactonase family protein [Verrucomicrobiota bacterium]
MKFFNSVRVLGLGGVLLGASAIVRAETWLVYFGTGGPGAKGIYRSTFDTSTGKLSAAELAAEVGSPGFLAVHPDGKKLYAAANFKGGPGAVAYQIGPKGALTVINELATGDGGAAHIAVHPSGRLVMTAQYGGGSVAVFPLAADGKLGPARVIEHEGGSRVVEKRQDSPHPHYVGWSPDGRFALVPDLGLDGIVIYRVEAERAEVVRHGFAASVRGGGPRHLKFSPDGRFIYLLNELSVSLTSFAWDAAAGTARQLGTVPSISETVKAGETHNSGAEILIHPSGRFLYYSNRGNDTVTVYRADPATAATEVIQVQPVRGAFPRNINLAPGAGWLLAAGADSNTVSVHQVNPQTGRLTYQTKGVINVPAPICIVFVKP